MLKKLPWITMLVTLLGALYFKDDIKAFLDKSAPSVSKFLKLTPKA